MFLSNPPAEHVSKKKNRIVHDIAIWFLCKIYFNFILWSLLLGITSWRNVFIPVPSTSSKYSISEYSEYSPARITLLLRRRIRNSSEGMSALILLRVRYFSFVISCFVLFRFFTFLSCFFPVFFLFLVGGYSLVFLSLLVRYSSLGTLFFFFSSFFSSPQFSEHVLQIYI